MSKQTDCVGFIPRDEDDPGCTQCDHEDVEGRCTFFYRPDLMTKIECDMKEDQG